MPVPVYRFRKPSGRSINVSLGVLLKLPQKFRDMFLGHNQSYHNAYRYWQYLGFLILIIILVGISHLRKGG